MKPPIQRLYQTDEFGTAIEELGSVFGDKKTGFWFVPDDLGEGRRKGSKNIVAERCIPLRFKRGPYRDRWKLAPPGQIERDRIEAPQPWSAAQPEWEPPEIVGRRRRPSVEPREKSLFD